MGTLTTPLSDDEWNALVEIGKGFDHAPLSAKLVERLRKVDLVRTDDRGHSLTAEGRLKIAIGRR